MVDCSGAFGNYGCSGGWPYQADEYLKTVAGDDTEECYGYKAHVSLRNLPPLPTPLSTLLSLWHSPLQSSSLVSILCVQDENCQYESSCVGSDCTGYISITKDSESALQDAVATKGPISVCIDASHASFQVSVM